MFIEGDRVKKKEGMKFIGTVLSCYKAPDSRDETAPWEDWIVVLLDKNAASDHLQHLYPARLFTYERSKS